MHKLQHRTMTPRRWLTVAILCATAGTTLPAAADFPPWTSPPADPDCYDPCAPSSLRAFPLPPPIGDRPSRTHRETPLPPPVGTWDPAPQSTPPAPTTDKPSRGQPQEGEKDWMPAQERERLLRDTAPAPTTSFDASDRPQEGEKDWVPTEEIQRPPPPPVVAAPEPRTDETPVVPERAPAPLAKTGDEPLYLECARVGDAYRCVPIDVVALERAVPKAVHPVAPIPTPVATGRVDRDVSESLDAVHDPRAEAPDPEAERTYGPVQRGDTVLEIAKQFFDAADINLFDAAAAIVRANPHAFHRGNPDLLMVATALDIPALDAARQRGGWASLIKQAPPTQVVESSHRTIPGTTPGDPIIHVRPVPLQDPQDVAVRTDFVRPGAGPAEPNTLLAHTRDPGTTAHPRTPLSAAAQTEIQELQRQIEMIDQRLQRSGGHRLY